MIINKLVLVLGALMLCVNIFSQENEVDLFIVAGQSNAVGVGDKDNSIKVKKGVAFEYDSQKNALIHLQDPVGSSYMGFQRSEDGSFVPSFGKTYNELANKKVVIVQCAKGGSSCHLLAETNDWGTWDNEGALFENCVEKVRKAEKFTKVKVKAVIWSQGENDGEAIANKIITKDEYEKSLKDLISRFRQEFGSELLFCIIETGHKLNDKRVDKGFSVVRSVQKKVARKDKQTYMIYSKTHKFKNRKWHTDIVHYDQTGLNDIGKNVAKNINKIMK
ncbi:hypothetical protein DMA11_15010 [Marinilabiliaceae bacterium JC017]|nr:hypothetical protein DMA11_15010 [Marinilabiliaceae bacterium JC017]